MPCGDNKLVKSEVWKFNFEVSGNEYQAQTGVGSCGLCGLF